MEIECREGFLTDDSKVFGVMVKTDFGTVVIEVSDEKAMRVVYHTLNTLAVGVDIFK